MAETVSISVKNNVSELKKINHILEVFVKSNNLSSQVLFALNLSIEEILTNIITYGFEDSSEHFILLRMEKEDGLINIRIEDDGKPFNPLDCDEPDLDKPLEDREMGGLGIFLIKSYMDDVQYQREENKNLISMTKRY